MHCIVTCTDTFHACCQSVRSSTAFIKMASYILLLLCIAFPQILGFEDGRVCNLQYLCHKGSFYLFNILIQQLNSCLFLDCNILGKPG